MQTLICPGAIDGSCTEEKLDAGACEEVDFNPAARTVSVMMTAAASGIAGAAPAPAA